MDNSLSTGSGTTNQSNTALCTISALATIYIALVGTKGGTPRRLLSLI